jgi:DNA-directed RNA polymerase subunit RPC12/RpoP
MDLKTVVGAVAIAVLLFFGVIFALASVYAVTRLYVAVSLFAVAFLIALFISRKPKTIVQQFEVSGEMKAAAIKCPNCSGSIDPNTIRIVDGVPYATCPYCGHNFQVTEEPKW